MLYPPNVVLEASALCNVSCLGCALHGPSGFVTRPFGNMKRAVWEPVIREIGSWERTTGIMAHGGGEPLLNPEFKSLIRLAKSFPTIRIGFLTNGMQLDAAWTEFILEVGLDWIAVSIDGVDPATHDQIRKRSNLVRVEENLDRLLAAKAAANSTVPDVKINMVAYDEIRDQVDPFVEKWIDKVDGVMVSNYRNPPESKRWPNVPAKREKCELLWNQAIVAWDGRIGLCCEDFNIDHSPGSIAGGQRLLDIWNSPELDRVRQLHDKGAFGDHPLCAACDSWAESYVRESSTHPKGYRMTTSPSQTLYTR